MAVCKANKINVNGQVLGPINEALGMMYHDQKKHILSYEHLFDCYRDYKRFEEEKTKHILVYILLAVRNAKGSIPDKYEAL